MRLPAQALCLAAGGVAAAVVNGSYVVVTAAVINGSCVVAATVVNGSCRCVTSAVVDRSYVVVASTVVTVHPVVLHIALTGSIVHLITSVIIHNVLLSGKLHRKVRLHVYSMNNCGIGAYNWGRKIRLFLLTFWHENNKINS